MVSSRPLLPVLFVAAVVVAVGSLAGCAHRRSERAMAAGLAAQQTGDTAGARALYEEALDRDERAVGAANNLALLALEAGDEQGAIALLARELGIHPTLPAARFNRALLLVRAGRYADAATDLAALTEGDARLPAGLQESARVLLAASRARQGREWTEIRDVFGAEPPAEVPADGPRRLGVRVVGVAAYRAGRFEDAAAWLAGDPRPGVATVRALALAQLGRVDDAFASLTSVAATTPADALGAAWVAYRAERPVAPALAAIPDPDWPTDGPVAWGRHRLLAAEHARAGRWSEAARALRAALAAGAPEEARLELVVALARSGELDDARLEVEAVLRADPGSPRARRLAELLD